MTLHSSCKNETNSFDSHLSICTDFCPAPHSNHLGGVSKQLYNWSHRTILIYHDHSFFFYLATWQRPPPTFTLQAKYWQMKNAKGKEILSLSSDIFQWLSVSKLEGSQLTQSQKISTGTGAGSWESPGGLFFMKFIYMSSSPYGPKKETTAGFVMNLWTQNRLRSLLCRDFCLQALGGLERPPSHSLFP